MICLQLFGCNKMSGEGTVILSEQEMSVVAEMPGPDLVVQRQLHHGGASVRGDRRRRTFGHAELSSLMHDFQLDLIGATAGNETGGEHVDARHRRTEPARGDVIGAGDVSDHVIEDDVLAWSHTRHVGCQAGRESCGVGMRGDLNGVTWRHLTA
jgi:hypothetical protein